MQQASESSGLKIFIVALLLVACISTAYCQKYPPNFNLVSNGSFELGSNDFIDTFNSSNFNCWHTAGKGTTGIISKQFFTDTICRARANTGLKYGCLGQNLPGVRHIKGSPIEWRDTLLNGWLSRSYFQTKILEPLIAGRTYYFTIWVGVSKLISKNISLVDCLIIGDIGVYFSKNGVYEYGNNDRININPQIKFTQWPIPTQENTFKYIKLTGIYKANGGEEFITIGNFEYYNNYHVLYAPLGQHTGTVSTGFPFIDDISLVSDTTLPILSLDKFSVGENKFLCKDQTVKIEASPYFSSYNWNTGDTGMSIIVTKSGTYWCDASFECGVIRDSVIVTEPDEIADLSLGKDTSNCLYGFFLDTITLQVPANNSTQIKWSTGSTSNLIKVHEPGAYWVQVSNVCYSVADTINITGCSAREVPKVDIPNAFSPNGDGKNDVFRLKYLPQQVVSFHLKIYNRYGQMVSELKSRTDEWDGGNYELGVYYYLFIYKDITGKEYTQKGDISLVR